MSRVSNVKKPLGSVNILQTREDGLLIEVCMLPERHLFRPEGERIEQRAVVALDGSSSMMASYGSRWIGTSDNNNLAQQAARDIGRLLSLHWSTSHDAHLIYWATGIGGEHVSPAGKHDLEDWNEVPVHGPERWGSGTHLLPALRHIAEDVGGISEQQNVVPSDHPRTLAVLILDGVVDDEEQVKNYAMKLGRKLYGSGLNEKVKVVLIGVGDHVDKDLLNRLDNLFNGTEMQGKIDLFASGVARGIGSLHELEGVIFGELWRFDTPFAQGSPVLRAGETPLAFLTHSSSDFLPGKFQFVLPHGITKFTLSLGGVNSFEVTQDITSGVQ